MRVEEVAELARKFNMADVSSRDVDDTTAEMAFEFVGKGDARAFATALTLQGITAHGPWRHELPDFPHMVTVYAHTE